MTAAELAAVAVGAVFVVAGVAKASDRGWVAAARQFGTPAVVARTIPTTEMVLGGLLVARLGAPWTALAAVALLVVFTVPVALHVAKGDTVPCACFGTTGRARPVSWRTLLRNAVLIALAVFATTARSGGAG